MIDAFDDGFKWFDVGFGVGVGGQVVGEIEDDFDFIGGPEVDESGEEVIGVKDGHVIFAEEGAVVVFFEMVVNEAVIMMDAEANDRAGSVGFAQFIEAVLGAFEEVGDFGVLLDAGGRQIELTGEFNGIVQVLDIGLVVFEQVSTKGLKGAGFLGINDIVVNAQLGANGFVAQNGQLDNDRQGIQHIQVQMIRLVVWQSIHR